MQKIGAAITTGCRCGAVILTSTFWAVVVFHEYPPNTSLFLLGLLFLIIGILGVAFCTKLSLYSIYLYNKYIYNKIKDSNDIDPSNNNSNNNEIAASNKALEEGSDRDFLMGVWWAIANGITGGTMVRYLSLYLFK
jgi:hypothetical protein